MVGPSLTDDERRLANNRLKLGFVLLVGFSSGLVALQAGGTTVQLAVAVVGGLILGVVLLYFVVRAAREFNPGPGGGFR
jgi:uncharacterized membrane protein (DUF485 family)